MSTRLATVKPAEAVPFLPYGTEAVDAIIASVRAQCAIAAPDISTKKGREEIASAAFKVSKKKTEFVKEVESNIEATKREVKRVDGERIRAVKLMDALRDEIRLPLTEWEGIEKERVAVRDRRLAEIDALRLSEAETQERIEARIANLAELSGFDWQEFAARAKETGDQVLSVLQGKLAERVKFDAEMAELARLRLETAEREQRERDERIKAEAASAARKEAEAVAKRERDALEAENKRKREEADREAGAEREAIEAKARKEREDLETQARKEREEAHAKELKAKAEAAEAERQRLTVQREKEAAEARAKKAEEDAARAVEDERRRVAEEDRRKADEEAKRESDQKHRKAVNNAAAKAIAAAGIGEETAKAVVVLIAKGEVPNVKISY